MENGSIRKTGLEVIQKLSEQKELRDFSEFETQLKHFQKRFQDEELRIAVVGEFSSGKSTFINALIGQDILKHALQETTATLTRLVNVDQNDARNGRGCVTLRDGSTIQLDNFQQLRDYTTTSSEKLDVAAQVAQVELYLSVFPSRHPIVIVDTPGLNGMADGHREQTEELVQQAHACIYLIQRRGLSESDLQILRKLTGFQKNFIFIQNFIDELNRAEGETLENKLAEQNAILQEKVFAQAADAQYSLCGLSAWQALVGRDHSIQTEYDGNNASISEQRREQLYVDSNFPQFLTLLKEFLREDRLTQIQYGGTAKAMISWMEDLIRQVELQKSQLDDAYELSADRQMVKRLDEMIQKTLLEQDQARQQLKNFIVTVQNQLKKAEKKALQESVETLQQEVLAEIRNYGSGTDCVTAAQGIDEWQKKSLTVLLNQKVHELAQKEQEAFVCREENVGQLLLDRINEYRGPKAEKLDLNPQTFCVDRLDLAPFDTEDKLKRDEQQIRVDKEKLKEFDYQIRDKAEQKRQVLADASLTESRYRSMKAGISSREERLGKRPEAERISETTWVNRGGLLGWLLGPKEVESVGWNDSAGEKWDREKQELEEWKRKEEELKQEMLKYQLMIERLCQEQADNEERRKKLESRIREREKQLERDRQMIEREKAAAADSYLTLAKKKLEEQVENFLSAEPIDGHLWYEMWRTMEKHIAAAEEEYTRLAMDQLEKAIRDKVCWLTKAKEGRRSELQKQAEVLGKYSVLLEQLKEKLEENVV